MGIKHTTRIAGTDISKSAIYGEDHEIIGGIATADIADNAVTTIKIADNAITSAKIAPDTVIAADIAAGAVGSSELAEGIGHVCATYIIYKSGSTYYSRDGSTGALFTSGAIAYDVIQATLNALTKGGLIFLKNAVYDLGSNKLTIPTNMYGAEVAIVGEAGLLQYTYEYRATSQLKDTILTFSGAKGIDVTSSATYEPMPLVRLENLRVRATNSTNYDTAIDLTYAMGAILHKVTTDVDWNAETTLPKTNTNGIKTGASPYGNIVLDWVFAYGYYNGFLLNADLVDASHIEACYCWNGVKTTSGATQCYRSLHTYACVNGFYGKDTTPALDYLIDSMFDEFYVASWMPDNQVTYGIHTPTLNNYFEPIVISPRFSTEGGGYARGITHYRFNPNVNVRLLIQSGQLDFVYLKSFRTNRYFDDYLQPIAPSTETGAWGVRDKNNAFPLAVDMAGGGEIKSQVSDFRTTVASKGIIVKTPDGTKSYRIRVDNTGAVVTELV